MDRAVEASAVPDKHNEEAVKGEVITEGCSGDTEDQDADASAHPEVTKYQDSEAIYHSEVPEDLDADVSAHPEVVKYH